MGLPRHAQPRRQGPQSEVYQAPNHETKAFTGARLGDHPMLETGTENNNMVQVDDPDASSGYRFIPDTSPTRPPDQRNYLFAEVDKDTSYAATPPSGSWAGTALEAKVGDRWYTTHHDVPDWSIQRDDPAATTSELPPGTTADDVTAIKAVAVPVGDPGDYTIHVRKLNRGIFRGQDFLPGASLTQGSGDAVLTPSQPEPVIWRR